MHTVSEVMGKIWEAYQITLKIPHWIWPENEPAGAQNPRERITLPQVMKHPWVTKRGAWPLQTVREMGNCPEEEEEINPQLVSLPDMMSTVNVLDVPRQVRVLWFPSIKQ